MQLPLRRDVLCDAFCTKTLRIFAQEINCIPAECDFINEKLHIKPCCRDSRLARNVCSQTHNTSPAIANQAYNFQSASPQWNRTKRSLLHVNSLKAMCNMHMRERKRNWIKANSKADCALMRSVRLNRTHQYYRKWDFQLIGIEKETRAINCPRRHICLNLSLAHSCSKTLLGTWEKTGRWETLSYTRCTYNKRPATPGALCPLDFSPPSSLAVQTNSLLSLFRLCPISLSLISTFALDVPSTRSMKRKRRYQTKNLFGISTISRRRKKKHFGNEFLKKNKHRNNGKVKFCVFFLTHFYNPFSSIFNFLFFFITGVYFCLPIVSRFRTNQTNMCIYI